MKGWSVSMTFTAAVGLVGFVGLAVVLGLLDGASWVHHATWSTLRPFVMVLGVVAVLLAAWHHHRYFGRKSGARYSNGVNARGDRFL
jgi:hypothetical protein